MAKRAGVMIFLFEFLLMSLGAEAVELPDFSHAEVQREDSSTVSDYRLILSSLNKINGQWRAGNELRLDGELKRKTLEVTGGHSAAEAYSFYIEQLKNNQGARELFSCEALKCGPSSSWANIRFQLKQLYGLDKYQQYSVWELGNREFLSLYAIRRGNKRVYIHIEVLTLEGEGLGEMASTPETISRALSVDGYFQLPDAALEEPSTSLGKNPHIQSLLVALSNKRLMKVTLVGHDNRAGSKQERIKRSSALAEAVKETLINSGVAENRLSVFGVGAMVPSALGDRAVRVVVVKE